MPATYVYECEACHEFFNLSDPLPKPAKDYSPQCPKCGAKGTSMAYSMPEKVRAHKPNGGGCCGGKQCC